MEQSDSELVRAVLDGDRQAFAILYDRYAPLVRALCRDETCDAHAAADLSQEVFLRAIRGLATLESRERFGAWLIGITRRVCLERRKDRRRPDAAARVVHLGMSNACGPQVGGDVEAAGGDLCESLERDERLAQLRAALAGLDERDRLALHGFYVQGLGVERLCELLGLSRSGLYHVLAAARRRLAAKLATGELRQ